jgi:hypothetical protein
MKNIFNEILIFLGGTCIALAGSFLINVSVIEAELYKIVAELNPHMREVVYFRMWAISTFFLLGSNLIIWGLVSKLIVKNNQDNE